MDIFKQNNCEILMFYKKKCIISQKALDLLKKKKDEIHSISYCIDENEWLNVCEDLKKIIKEHKTTPIIIWNGRFLGGYRELKSLLY